MAEEYKFPDEQDVAKKADSAEPDIQVEVEDDTPPEDRNKAPLPRNMVEAVSYTHLTLPTKA